MIYAGYVCKSRTETGRVKFENSPGTREAKVSLCEGKKMIESGFTESVTEGCAVFRAWLR